MFTRGLTTASQNDYCDTITIAEIPIAILLLLQAAIAMHCDNYWRQLFSSRKLLRIKVTPDLHLIYSKNGGNLGLVLKMKNVACLSILLTKHVKYTYLYLFKFVLYSIVAFKAN